jgi:hypothetical protein
MRVLRWGASINESVREKKPQAAVKLPQYLSEAWAQEALKLIETDARLQRALNGLEVSVLTIVLNPPKGCYGFLYVSFDKGGLADFRTGHDFGSITKDLPEPTFVVSGDYSVFAQVQRRELSERRAILSGKLHLTGSMVKALRYMRILETITEVAAEIPCKT